jgi:hypothetical protein
VCTSDVYNGRSPHVIVGLSFRLGLYFCASPSPIPYTIGKPQDTAPEPKAQKRNTEPHDPLHGHASPVNIVQLTFCFRVVAQRGTSDNGHPEARCCEDIIGFWASTKRPYSTQLLTAANKLIVQPHMRKEKGRHPLGIKTSWICIETPRTDNGSFRINSSHTIY